MLEPKPRPTLLRRFLVAALTLAACRIGHRMRLIEDDHPIEIAAEPCGDLLDPARLAFAALRAKRRIGGEEDAFGKPDRGALPEARQRRDEQALLPQRRPVALRILKQLVRLRDPKRPAAALQPVVENDPRDLAALARAGPVAEEPAAPELDRHLIVFARGAHHVPRLVDGPRAGQMVGMGLASIDDRLKLGIGQETVGSEIFGKMRAIRRLRRRDRRHRRRLNQRGRMG